MCKLRAVAPAVGQPDRDRVAGRKGFKKSLVERIVRRGVRTERLDIVERAAFHEHNGTHGPCLVHVNG